MNDNAVAEVLSRIDKAVEAAGKGAKYGWPKLVTYTRVIGIAEAISFVVVIVASVVAADWAQRKGMKAASEESDKYLFILITAYVVGIAAFIIGAIVLPGVVAKIISPEARVILYTLGN